MRCMFPGCNNEVAAITKKNARFSKMYCEEHSNGIDVECSICHNKYHAKMSDVIPTIKSKKPIICRKCFVTALNKTDKMREQAKQLGLKTGKQNIIKAREKAFTPEAIRLRNETKKKNGFYDPNGGYYQGLKTRKENGSFQKMLDASHSSEVVAKKNKTRWKNMSEDDRLKQIKRLIDSQTESSRQKIYETRKKNGLSPNIDAARKQLDKLKQDEKWIKEHPDFFGINLFSTVNGITMYRNIPWDEFVKSFSVCKYESMNSLAEKLNGFIQSTFRSNDSMYWENKGAFEKELVNKGVNWFVYIKFYINHATIKPLVVGKSGSKNVTINGSDICFDYLKDNDNRPARRFLKENSFDWYKENILIIPCDSEQIALNLEKELTEELNLFES